MLCVAPGQRASARHATVPRCEHSGHIAASSLMSRKTPRLVRPGALHEPMPQLALWHVIVRIEIAGEAPESAAPNSFRNGSHSTVVSRIGTRSNPLESAQTRTVSARPTPSKSMTRASTRLPRVPTRHRRPGATERPGTNRAEQPCLLRQPSSRGTFGPQVRGGPPRLPRPEATRLQNRRSPS